ncbi:hypothetical protein V498_01872 [Pseudogymnoascus sp. VKM F-4517 (FW-2822)]|nr:hypothetical protein V498_01872 [Pseudogymnoascus sp. VKM F-4517 (FW-2822)]
MADLQNAQRCVEVKIRTLPNAERSDRKDVSRVFLSMDTLIELRMEAGQPCSVWKVEDADSRREAIAWPSAQKINRNVMQMFKSFQDHCGFRLEDRIAVAPAGPLVTADCVVLRDISGGTALEEKDRAHWEWYLEDKLVRAESIFSDMLYEITLKGRRSFIVESFLLSGRPLPNKVAHFSPTSRVQIIDEQAAALERPTTGPRPALHVSGIAGIDSALQKLNDVLADFSDVAKTSPTWGRRACGVLLHGAHGSGKTLLLERVAATGWGRVFRIDADAKMQAIREIFKDARLTAPSIILLDDLEALAAADPPRPATTALLSEEMARLSADSVQVVVLAAAASASAVPLPLRKRGRFTTDILLPIPDADARRQILRSLGPGEEEEVKLLDRLAERTHAYTAEDLALLLDRASFLARHRRRGEATANPPTNPPGQLELPTTEASTPAASSAPLETPEPESNTPPTPSLTQPDLDLALLSVRPTAMHDITLRPPKVHWSDIGGQHALKRALRRAVETPLRHPALLARLGAAPKKGLLLYGPPGCSKTLSAAAVATEAGFNFFAVKGAELLNMYVGESERAVREVFARARGAAPSIVFFDEVEAIGGKREGRGGGGVNVLTTLLNEMDGIETLKGVMVLAATNKPEALDVALLRPGRFDELLYVAPPDLEGRVEILEGRRRKMDWEADVEVGWLAERCEGYSGAELVGVCQAACDCVIDRALETGDMAAKVGREDFEVAMGRVKKQITEEMVEGYRRWAKGVGNGVEAD